tara:strand:- start:45 stop:227 length:183 start_codon:yes stop_codon:yes gene_type:complete
MKELKLDEHELKYLTLVVEDKLEQNKAFMDMDSELTDEDKKKTFMDMLHDLYSKLIILNK